MSETRDRAALSHSGVWYLLHGEETTTETQWRETETEEEAEEVLAMCEKPETSKEKLVHDDKFDQPQEMQPKSNVAWNRRLNKTKTPQEFSCFPSRPQNNLRWSLKPGAVNSAG